MHKAPDLLCLAGAGSFGALGVGLLVSNPAGTSTRDDAYGPDAPLQLWVIICSGLGFFVAAACLLGAAYGLWIRFTRGFEPWDNESGADGGPDAEAPEPDEPHRGGVDSGIP